MLALGSNNLYDYRLQTLSQVQGMLEQLLQTKERMVALNVPVIQKMYGYLESINDVLKNPPANRFVLGFHQSVITFLDADLVEIFLNSPLDQDMRDNLSTELVFIAAAVGKIPTLTSAYSEEEVMEVLKGKGGEYYDDVPFVYSLGKFLEANASANLFSAMVKTLPSVAINPDNVHEYYWDDAFILVVLLHCIWRHFFLLSETEQQFLLQNYFYQSIISGVPVRLAIQDAAKRTSVRAGGEKTLRLFRESLLNGKETIPTNTLSRQGRLVGEVVKEFTDKSATEQINTLVQEKYIADMYRGKVDVEFYSQWLRETLTIVWQLKTGDILK